MSGEIQQSDGNTAAAGNNSAGGNQMTLSFHEQLIMQEKAYEKQKGKTSGHFKSNWSAEVKTLEKNDKGDFKDGKTNMNSKYEYNSRCTIM
ncbi:hypothetical protein PoB_000602000 [Plakobranchus ocellatus]|uniref:Uncharacterized protein n=1 Tax=Plakobranchus ocellatus TaxID=259542 RepID=A0AAV3Y9R1_9GAST|nr:hypothetical protein PoB_000602000 [Plakobranchus ocellatus]